MPVAVHLGDQMATSTAVTNVVVDNGQYGYTFEVCLRADSRFHDAAIDSTMP